MAKRLKLNIGNDGKIGVTSLDEEKNDNESEKRKVRLKGEVVNCGNDKLRFVRENRFEDSEQFFSQFSDETTKMGLTHANTNKIMELSKKLIETHTILILKALHIENEGNENTVKTIKETAEHMNKELDEMSSTLKRLEVCRKNPLFVEPKEVTLSLKWRSKTYTDTDLPSNNLIPSACQYVSIRKTLSAVFSQPDF